MRLVSMTSERKYIMKCLYKQVLIDIYHVF